MPLSLSLPFDACVVPDGLQGPVAIYVTNDPRPLANNPRDGFIGNIVAGPTMAFLDGTPEALSNLAKSGSAVVSGGGVSETETASTVISTSTISPDEASSILASASATASRGSSEG